MRHSLHAAAAAALFALAGAPLAGPAAAPAAGAGGTVPPARDPAAGMRAALERALAEGTNGALVLFIARYPDEPLAEEARTALEARGQPDAAPFPGPDGEIVAAFDRARLAGPAALAAFARAYAGHPLAAEARRPFWSR